MDYVCIIPSRNRYDLALRAVRSVLAQSVPPQEILLVDDASTDTRYEWLEEVVDDARLTVMRRPVASTEEHGTGFAVGAVRNTALSHIYKVGFVGWVAFLDDDDEWMPEKMGRQLAITEAHSAHRVICSNAINRSLAGRVQGMHLETHGYKIRDGLFDVTPVVSKLNPVVNSTAIVHTVVTERLQGQRPTGYCEDWDYWRRAAELTSILRIEDPLIWYTVGNRKEYTR